MKNNNMNLEQIKTQPDHMSEENLRFCDFASSCNSFTNPKCDYEFHRKCPIAIAHYILYARLKERILTISRTE